MAVRPIPEAVPVDLILAGAAARTKASEPVPAPLEAVERELREARRFEAAVAVMAAFAVNGRPGSTVPDVAAKAVEWADRLLEKLGERVP